MKRNILSIESAGLPLAVSLLCISGVARAQDTPPAAINPFAAGLTLVPPIGPGKPLSLPPIAESTLANGLRIVVMEDHRQPALYLRLAVPAGTVRDPEDKIGLAAMTAGLLTQGTTKHSEAQIAARVDSLGATLNASAGPDYLTVSADGLSTHADDLFDLLSDVTLHPAFPADEMDRYRLQAQSDIQANLGQPATLANAALDRLVYGTFAYGDYAEGTPASLKGITRTDVAGFHDTYFAPNVATLFLVGDVTPAQARAWATKWFGAWQRKDVPAPPAAPTPAVGGGAGTANPPAITILDRPRAQQTEVRIGTLVPGYDDPDRVAGNVATAVLGMGQFDSRLTVEIRVKRGLTYGVSSYFGRNKEAGAFEISTFTKNASTGEVVRLALAEADKLVKTPPPPMELSDRKAFLNGSFAMSVASPSGLLTRLTTAVLYGGGPSDLTRYTQRVEAITAADAQRMIANLHLDAAPTQIVLVGDAKAIAPQVAGLGTVRTIEPADLDILSPTLTRSDASTPPASTPPMVTPPTGMVAPSPATPGDAAARALLQTAVAAHGGDAFLHIQTLAATGTGEIRPPGMGGLRVAAKTATLCAADPDRARVALGTSYGDLTVVAPGNGKAIWYRFDDITHDVPGVLVGDPTAVLRQAAREGWTVQSDGAVAGENNGAPLPGLALVDAQGHATHAYFDPITHLLRRTVKQMEGGTARFDLSEYQTVADGVQLPARIDGSLNGQRVLTLRLSAFTLNPPITDAQFARPVE